MKHFEKIDGLRSIAILFVLVEHFAPSIGHRISAGYYGVDLFFVISGFLITNILLESRGSFLAAYGRFMGRRTLRIFPLYYLTIGFLLAVGYQPCRDALPYLATYTYNYAWIKHELPTSMLSPFWSLAVEEQFYLFWPFLILSFRNRRRVLFGLITGIAALCFVQLTSSPFEAVEPYNFVGLFPRAGSLCLGAMGALIRRRSNFLDELFKNLLLEWIVLAGLVATLLTSFDLKYLVLGLGSLYLVLKASHSEFQSSLFNRFLSHPWALHLGKVSYGVYIFHVPIGLYINDTIIEPWWWTIDFASFGRFEFLREAAWVIALPLYSGLAVGLATLSHRFLETPILSLKDRWFRQ